MPRLPRADRPGGWFHVYNRGLARRTVFETRADVRFFLACLVRAVRRGELEIHAFCVLTTHFHLLVRSPTGSLAVAMDRVQNAYVRYYNRSRRRDGSLFRGRYGARPADSLAYRRILVRYIDRNPVSARLVSTPWSFPYCSAWHYVQPRRPRWLCPDWVDAEVTRRGYARPCEGYAVVFGRAASRCENALVEGRMERPANLAEVLDDLLDAAPPAVLDWMRRTSTLADGRAAYPPVVDPESVSEVLHEEREQRATWTYETHKGQARDAWAVAEAYLLRCLAGLRWADIARRQGVTPSMASRRARRGQALVDTDERHAARLADLAKRAVDRAHGGGR